MNSAIERLLTLRVGDVMNPEVRSVPIHARMAEAAKILSENQITGAPVVDELGHCVGVLSSSDFATRDQGRSESGEFDNESVEHVLVRDKPGGTYHIEQQVEDQVEQHMTSAVQTVRADEPLLTASRMMCSEHIHRLIVVDEDETPVGIMSSLDVVAALVAAIGE